LNQVFFAYILKCKDQTYYVGHTENIETRLAQHQSGELGGYTSLRLPVELAYLETFPTRDEAFIVERKIKKWSRPKKEALCVNDWQKIKNDSKKIFK